MRNHIVTLMVAGVLMAGCSQAQQSQVQQDAQQGLKAAGKAVESTLDTARLKSALMASSKLDASHIDVDKEGNTYYLRGSVLTVDDKARAFRLAQDMVASSESVVDELKVGPAPQ